MQSQPAHSPTQRPSHEGMNPRLDVAQFRRAAGTSSRGRLRGVRPSEGVIWNDSVDVLVIGSGGAGFAAACAAVSSGASVLMLERAQIWGGTTRSSGGGVFICNNPWMQQQGIEDPRADALKYLARCADPIGFDPDSLSYGLSAESYALLERFYDEGERVVRKLAQDGAVNLNAPNLAVSGLPSADYCAHYVEDAAPRGRCLKTLLPDGSPGVGADLICMMKSYVERHGGRLRLATRVEELVEDRDGKIVGVAAHSLTHGQVFYECRNAVIFGSGGFTHDQDRRKQHLRGPSVGGCGVPTNTGDLITMATAVGAELGNMTNAFWNQQVFEHCDDFSGTNLDVWHVPGDSMILVNRFGRRVVNEKREYQQRAQIHHVWAADEFPNYLLFMIYDERCAQRFAGQYPIPRKGVYAPHILRAESLKGLVNALDARLQQLWETRPMSTTTGRVRMDPDAAKNLEVEVARYNKFAQAGTDEDFGRGRTPVELDQVAPGAQSGLSNPLMHPLSKGPYYATILTSAAFETCGGPRTDVDGRVLRSDGTAVPGLFAVGNCAAGIFGAAYPGGGSTLGPAIVFGTLAGEAAALAEPTP